MIIFTLTASFPLQRPLVGETPTLTIPSLLEGSPITTGPLSKMNTASGLYIIAFINKGLWVDSSIITIIFSVGYIISKQRNRELRRIEVHRLRVCRRNKARTLFLLATRECTQSFVVSGISVTSPA